MKYNKNEKKSIENYALELENMRLCDSSPESYSAKGNNKGKLGQQVEFYHFGLSLNSRKEADFKEAGIELKVAPIKQIRKQPSSNLKIKRIGWSAKERIVISIINFFDIVKEEWDNASIRKKMNMLLMFYVHNSEIPVNEQIFKLISLWSPNSDDIEVIKKDWELIRDKVVMGSAHEISEGDTMYLGACTKGSTSAKSRRKQPYSNEKAMQRAFSLKRSYVDFILEELLLKKENKTIEIKKTPDSLTFDERLLNCFSNLKGKSLLDIQISSGVNRERKSKNYLNLFTRDLIKKVYGNSVWKSDEFQKAGIEMKCVLLKPNDVPKESMSFEQIQYTEIVNEEWYNSTIREKFENKKHLWVVFKAIKKYSKQSELTKDEIIFDDMLFWNMPIGDLDNEYQMLWEDTVNKIKIGEYNSFMKSKDNTVGHIRPKGRDSKDLMLTPQGSYEKKKCFWLNAKYIASEIKRMKDMKSYS